MSEERAARQQRLEGQRKPFRAVDVLSGRIDQRTPDINANATANESGAAKPARARKQISAQLEPEQLRLLGELHARLNATATERIEKSDLVGLGIELLAAVLDEATASRGLAPAPDGSGRGGPAPLATLADVRTYARTHVRVGAERGRVRPAGIAAVAELDGGGSAIEG